MALAKYKNKRDENESELFQMFRALGCTVYALDTPADCIVGYRGVSHLVEIKTLKGKLTASQVKFISNWNGDHHIVRTIDEVQALVRSWRESE